MSVNWPSQQIFGLMLIVLNCWLIYKSSTNSVMCLVGGSWILSQGSPETRKGHMPCRSITITYSTSPMGKDWTLRRKRCVYL